MKFWKVEAKCGHTGKTKFLVKSFYVKAETGKDAAYKVRWMPRVKHHHKDAIKSVTEITKDEYLMGLKSHEADMYFHVCNKQEQQLKCIDLDYETFYEEAPKTYKKKTHAKKRLVEKQLFTEWMRERRNQTYEQD